MIPEDGRLGPRSAKALGAKVKAKVQDVFDMPSNWARWYVWMWLIVAAALLPLLFFVPFIVWSIAVAVGFGVPEAIGNLHPTDKYPPLTHVVRWYLPRWVAIPAMWVFTIAAGGTWFGFPHPLRLALLLGLLGWFNTHFDTNFDQVERRGE